MVDTFLQTAALLDDSFASLGLSEPVLASVRQVGFERPTPIQKAVIPVALTGQDLIGLAETGSGKTAAFVLPLAEKLTHGKGVRGLILCPTREIALQTKAFLDLFGKDHKLNTVCLIGGVKMGPQIRDLKKIPDIIVATPGRLVDHMERGLVHLNHIQELVLDEADHMLDMGFLPQIEKILSKVPHKRHTLMFSATMPPSIGRLAQRYLHNPVQIDILPEGRTAQGITHRLYLVSRENKGDCLLSLLKEFPVSTLVFARMKIDADWLSRILESGGLDIAKIHSNLTQKERVEALERFRTGKQRILVATDIASRGIDIPGIQHIINFDVPDTIEDYIHRAGRTARGDAIGTVSTIATWQDKPTIKQIELALGQELPRCTALGVEPYIELKLDPNARRIGRRGRR